MDSVPVENIFNNQTEKLKFTTSAEVGYRIDSTQSLLSRVQYRISNQSAELNQASSFSPVFGTASNSLLQVSTQNETAFTAEMSLQKPFLKQKSLVTIGFMSFNQSLDASTDPLQPEILNSPVWNTDAWLSDNTTWLSGKVFNKFKKYRYNSEMKVKYLQRNFQASGEQHNYWLADWRGGVYFDFSKFHNFYVSTSYQTQPTPFNQLLRYYQIKDENSVKIEQVDSNFVVQKTGVDIYYNSAGFTPASSDAKFTYLISMNATIQQNEIIYQPIVQENFLIYQSLLSPSSTQVGTNLVCNYKITPKTTIASTSFRWSVVSGYVARQEQLVGIQTQQANFSVSLQHTFYKRLQCKLNQSIRYQYQKITGSPATKFSDSNTELSLIYNHYKWRANAFVSYQNQEYSSISNRNWPLSFHLERRFSKPSISIFLVGRNVLNLRGNSLILPDFGANYTGFESFQTIGGQIMAGISCQL